MEWAHLVVSLIVGALSGGGISTLLRIRHDKRKDIRQEDRADNAQSLLARAQTFNELKDVITILRAQLEESRAAAARLEARVDLLEDKRRADALAMRAQGDHIDVLEQHIWRGDPPPPPPRPAAV